MSSKGLRGTPAFCPSCGGSCKNIEWDPETDVNTCVCGWRDNPDREWQIDDIARTICGQYDKENNRCRCDPENGVCDLDCWAGRKVSTDLYNAGYRKQLKGTWVRQKPGPEAMRIFHETELDKGMSINSIYWACSVCGHWGKPHHKYCSSCGAKMKGGE